MSAGNSPILGIPHLDPSDAASSVYSSVNGITDQLERYTTPVFSNAGARDTAIPAPSDGMRCRLLSPAIEQSYSATAGQWLQIAPAPIGYSGRRSFASAHYDGGAPRDLATVSYSFAYPYMAIVTACIQVVNLTANTAMSFWLNQSGAGSPYPLPTVDEDQVRVDKGTARVFSMLAMPTGGTLTVNATLSGALNQACDISTDFARSYMESVAIPLGTHL